MYLFFKQKKEENRKTGVEFWLSESSDVSMKFRRVRGAACGIGGGWVCVCLFQKKLANIFLPLIFDPEWHFSSTCPLSPCLRKKKKST